VHRAGHRIAPWACGSAACDGTMPAMQSAVVLAVGVALITLLVIANAPTWVVVLATATYGVLVARFARSLG
jgi:hypothetical protein